jgi:hypothetical protein
MTGLDVLGRTTAARIALAGLGIGIAGLVIQWIADPGKFPAFPPGIAIIAVFGALAVLTAKWWWSPLLATLISLWIGGVGFALVIRNFGEGNTGLVIGTAVMAVGLYGAAVAGIVAAVQGFRRRDLGSVPPAVP